MNKIMTLVFIIFFCIVIETFAKQLKVYSRSYFGYDITLVLMDTDNDDCYDWIMIFQDDKIIIDEALLVKK